jgi:2-polyprenyl-3-methyl-5-hydroxy-6-metoxy-1,4-benzoquinol methylase
MLNPFTYTFHPVTRCSMCHASVNDARILGKRMNQTQGFKPHKKVGITITVMQCQKCGLIFSNPMPLPKSLDDHYGIPPESYWNEEYFKVDPSYFSGEIAWLNRLRKIQKGQRSLDIGAGIGKQMIALAAIGFDVYGLEPSEPFYHRAIDNMNIPKERLKLSSIENAEYENNSFDFISFGVVLEHLKNPSDSIRKALTWLKPEGIIHFEVPSSKWLINRIINLQYILRGLDYVTNLSPMHQPYHLYEFSLEAFVKNGQINNYSVIDHGYYVCKTFMPAWMDPILKPIMKATNTGMQLCVWIKR